MQRKWQSRTRIAVVYAERQEDLKLALVAATKVWQRWA